MRTRLFLVPALLAAAPASAGMLAPSACRSDLSPASRIVSEAMATVEVLEKMRGGMRCAAYQDHFLAAVRAPDVSSAAATALIAIGASPGWTVPSRP